MTSTVFQELAARRRHGCKQNRYTPDGMMARSSRVKSAGGALGSPRESPQGCLLGRTRSIGSPQWSWAGLIAALPMSIFRVFARMDRVRGRHVARTQASS